MQSACKSGAASHQWRSVELKWGAPARLVAVSVPARLLGKTVPAAIPGLPRARVAIFDSHSGISVSRS